MNMALAQQELAVTVDLPGTLTGTVTRVAFHNVGNGYCVLRVEAEALDELVTAVGYLPRVREGDEYRFEGQWKDHPKFGRQFQFESADVIMPTGREGLVAYLSDIAYGVGPVRAGKIVDALGLEALDKIQADPGCLARFDFLTANQRQDIIKHLAENRTLAELSALICRHGITPRLAARIYNQYGDQSVDVVKQNPYVLSEDVWGVGFLTADKVAQAVGVSTDSPFRVQAAVEYVIREAQAEGHCFLRPRDIVPRVQELVGAGCGVGVPEIAEANARLIEAGRLVRDDYAVYMAGLYEAETSLARRMRALSTNKVEAPRELDELLRVVERGLSMTYHPKQRDAVRMALSNRLSIITGPPGSGKTTIIKSVVRAFKELEPLRTIYLASPTGRAAKRLAEATAHEAKTIHRLLEYNPEIGFQRNEENPLAPGLLIVDEFSMCDVSLADTLFAAAPASMQAVLVGDVDQLPSVGPGSVLRDSILSGAIPTTRLEYVYRQEEGSGISALANDINQGVIPVLSSGPDVTCVEVAAPDEAALEALNYASWACRQYGPMGFGVLAPMKKGESGVESLNRKIRDLLNPAHRGPFSEGDKVMVIRNNYQFEVFNGDLGMVVATDKGGSVIDVDFGDRHVVFGYDEDAEDEYADPNLLTLAFATTIHKAQGSEFPCVIVVLTRQHYIMLARNLMYTAITRAKKRLVLIHQSGAVKRAVNNNQIAERYSRLAERLKG